MTWIRLDITQENWHFGLWSQLDRTTCWVSNDTEININKWEYLYTNKFTIFRVLLIHFCYIFRVAKLSKDGTHSRFTDFSQNIHSLRVDRPCTRNTSQATRPHQFTIEHLTTFCKHSQMPWHFARRTELRAGTMHAMPVVQVTHVTLFLPHNTF